MRRCGDDLDSIAPGLEARLDTALADVLGHWPEGLARSAIHADLFPDNVLMRGDQVAGLIDFYFACTDIRAYALAVTHSAWAFATAGTPADTAVEIGRAACRERGCQTG